MLHPVLRDYSYRDFTVPEISRWRVLIAVLAAIYLMSQPYISLIDIWQRECEFVPFSWLLVMVSLYSSQMTAKGDTLDCFSESLWYIEIRMANRGSIFHDETHQIYSLPNKPRMVDCISQITNTLFYPCDTGAPKEPFATSSVGIPCGDNQLNKFSYKVSS